MDADETAEKLINATLMAQFGKELPAALNNVSDMYSTAFVNTDADLDAIAEDLKRTRRGGFASTGRPGQASPSMSGGWQPVWICRS